MWQHRLTKIDMFEYLYQQFEKPVQANNVAAFQYVWCALHCCQPPH